MLRALPLDALLNAVAKVGVNFTVAEDRTQLVYVWLTRQEEVLYVGKGESGRRTAEEARWSGRPPNAYVTLKADGSVDDVRGVSGVVSLLAGHDAVKRELGYPTLDRTALRNALTQVAQLDPKGFLLLRERGGAPAPLSGGGSSVTKEITSTIRMHVADYLRRVTPFTHADAEKLLIRTAVHGGFPIGNSQFASQWESPLWTAPDALALLAVILSPQLRPPT